jgi:hypothetical protein
MRKRNKSPGEGTGKRGETIVECEIHHAREKHGRVARLCWNILVEVWNPSHPESASPMESPGRRQPRYLTTKVDRLVCIYTSGTPV